MSGSGALGNLPAESDLTAVAQPAHVAGSFFALGMLQGVPVSMAAPAAYMVKIFAMLENLGLTKW